MELRDLVLSTLEELDDRIAKEEEIKAKIIELEEEEKREIQNPVSDSDEENRVIVKRSDDELAFLRHTKERLETLFEGLKSSEIKDPEAKLELTLKYLQLLLAQVNERVAEIKS
jgi:hypothetical protein